jgi:raffinose/stachyose/melibiose transport system permease protein
MTTAATLTAHESPPRSKPRRDPAYWLYLLPGATLFVLIIALPLVYTGYLSMTRWSGIGDPQWVGLENYQRLLEDEVFWISFKNTIAMIVAMVVVPTLLGLVLASVLFDVVGRRFHPRTASVMRAAIYLPQVLPVVVAGIVWGWILRPDGALNAVLSSAGLGFLEGDWLGDPDKALPSVMMVMIWVQIGYPVVVFMAAMERVDPELFEAAELDGAGWRQRFTAITLPQVRPETFVVALTCTIAALKVFGPIYALTRGGPENATNVPSYYAYFTFFKKLQVGYGSAIAIVLTLIIVVVAMAFIWAQQRGERREAGA